MTETFDKTTFFATNYCQKSNAQNKCLKKKPKEIRKVFKYISIDLSNSKI